MNRSQARSIRRKGGTQAAFLSDGLGVGAKLSTQQEWVTDTSGRLRLTV
jgi:hypothetical protein